MFRLPFLKISGYGILAFLTLEGAARIDDAVSEGAAFCAPYTINTLFQPSQFGREGKPGARFGKWTMNRLGYRGPEPAPGRINIVAFGASETFGLYESAGHEYPRALEGLLNSEGPPRFNVINLALPGVRIGRRGYLVRGIEQTQAKAVIIYPSPANYIGTTEPLCNKPIRPVSNELAPLDHIRIKGKVEELAKRNTPAWLMTQLRRYIIWSDVSKVTVVDRVPQSTIEAFKTDISCAARAAQQAGATVILVTHATYFGQELKLADRPMMTSWRRFYPELSESGFLDLEQRANAAVEVVGVDLNATVVDASRSIPPGSANFADFVHFTTAGAGQMAAILKPAVLTATSP